MLDLLGIKSLRDPVNARTPEGQPGAANYDESKANPYPKLPDPLVLKNGRKVTSAEMWWKQRRPEIVEDFDREVYGRVPKVTPKVKWEVVNTAKETNGDVPVITKQVVGHVDNSSYPQITVDIQLTLTTPASATGRVPVMMEFGGMGFLGGRGAPALPKPPAGRGPTGPTWQQQVLAKGWGYAILSPASIQADNGAGLTQGIIGLVNKGQPRKPDDWGALRAWAWGASRALDYFETDKSVDAKQVGDRGPVPLRQGGHSRHGVRAAFRDRLHRLLRRGRRQAPPPQLGRTGGERRGGERIPLDGRQLSQVRRPADLERSAGGLARAGRHVRSAPDLHQCRQFDQPRD